ncbi:MAG: hypothetical protein UY90_C0011G0024 [Candidatus Peregrinibacteria bacterium GW2011_GWA2_54_9]|nr:MAG: hypothetical protein UY90_C0011G0024 [Candidatus Peregrinibacteria bacterium GW2011_GWA2_54_9]
MFDCTRISCRVSVSHIPPRLPCLFSSARLQGCAGTYFGKYTFPLRLQSGSGLLRFLSESPGARHNGRSILLLLVLARLAYFLQFCLKSFLLFLEAYLCGKAREPRTTLPASSSSHTPPISPPKAKHAWHSCSLTARPHTASGSRTLSCRSCSVESWHNTSVERNRT